LEVVVLYPPATTTSATSLVRRCSFLMTPPSNHFKHIPSGLVKEDVFGTTGYFFSTPLLATVDRGDREAIGAPTGEGAAPLRLRRLSGPRRCMGTVAPRPVV
jgi:hypothetical protein